MKAYEKFEARLRELGLHDEWCQQGKIGRVGTETDGRIIILVHEDNNDKYTEFVYPPMSELEKDENFRNRALDEFALPGWDDYMFIGKMYAWANDHQSHDCPLNPVDVYFLSSTHLSADFEDDKEEVAGVMGTWDFDSDTIEEYCPHCDTTVELEFDFKVQECPNCGKWIVPCSICPLDGCPTKCPLERLSIMRNGEDTKQ